MYSKEDEALKVLCQKLSDIQEEAMRTYQETSLSQANNKNRFFNLIDEYADTKYGDDGDNLSGCLSDSSSIANVREDGYSSDCSGMSTYHQHSGKRIRKTQQKLDSKHNSVIIDECASDTDVSFRERDGERRKRNKYHRNDKNKTENKGNEKSQKRRSWTDSGVSLTLSRTDQSRCGTFENAVNGKSSNVFVDINQNVSIAKESVENETGNLVLMRRRSSSCTQRKSSDSKSFNRLSQLTNRSSLTNVTILTSNSMSSLSSMMMSPSEIDYLTDSKTTDEDEELNNNLQRETEIVKGSLASVTSSSTVTENSTMENKIKEERGTLSTEQVITNIDPNIKLQLFIDKLNNGNKENLRQPENHRKRGSILKRMKARFRPRVSSDKNYKDVSSEFSFEKIHNDKETEQSFEVVTPDVLKRLRAEESALANSFEDDFEYYDEEDEMESKEDALERLSSTPTKDKTFIGKFFKRTRSYSVSPQVEKKNKNKKFNRNSLRASVRSNPEISFKSDILNEQNSYTHSLEQMDMKHGHGQTNSTLERESVASETYFMYEHNTTGVHNNVKHSSSEYCILQQPMSPPISPVQGSHESFDIQRFQSLHSVNDRCNCNDCLYGDYLDFLEFQKFRRYYANQCHGTCCVPEAHHTGGEHSRPSSLGHVPVCNLKNQHERCGENIVAPLVIRKDTEKEARNFRTSKYESFV